MSNDGAPEHEALKALEIWKKANKETSDLRVEDELWKLIILIKDEALVGIGRLSLVSAKYPDETIEKFRVRQEQRTAHFGVAPPSHYAAIIGTGCERLAYEAEAVVYHSLVSGLSGLSTHHAVSLTAGCQIFDTYVSGGVKLHNTRARDANLHNVQGSSGGYEIHGDLHNARIAEVNGQILVTG